MRKVFFNDNDTELRILREGQKSLLPAVVIVISK